MKVTKSKPVKSSKVTKAEKRSNLFVESAKPKGKAIPKGKPRIIGCGTHQLKKHAPRVV